MSMGSCAARIMMMMIIMLFGHDLVELSSAAFLMSEQATTVAISSTAGLTHVGLLARMRVRVLLQGAQSFKRLSASLAQIVGLPGVPGEMSPERRAYSEGSTAHMTHEGFVTCVDADVIGQTGGCGEAAVADLTDMWFDACVGTHVIRKRRVAWIDFAADVAQVFTRYLLLGFGVGLLMESEASSTGAHLLTDLADRRLGFGLMHDYVSSQSFFRGHHLVAVLALVVTRSRRSLLFTFVLLGILVGTAGE